MDADTPVLGDAGKKALDAMKTQWRLERAKRRAAQADVVKLRALLHAAEVARVAAVTGVDVAVDQ